MTVRAVRGTRDVYGADVRVQEQLTMLLNTTLDSAGYEPIDLPVLEHRDLYLKKAGEDLLAKLYHWTQAGRELALRPEWTASVLRAAIAILNDAPQPLRLRYAGPVFRYERPSRGTYRQFTQIGLELLGAAGPLADAEVIGTAVAGLNTVGIRTYTLTLGHIGLIKACLGSLGLAERTTSALAWSLERVRREGINVVREQWSGSATELPLDVEALQHLSDQDIEILLLHALPSLGVQLNGGGREPTHIVNRLVRKLRHADEPAQIERAWHMLASLSEARGLAGAVLPTIERLLHEQQIDPAPLDEFKQTLDLLEEYGITTNQIQIDFGMGRGLHYYTGMIFEIDGADGLQLCGGGRYDDLVAALGGQALPAVGCAYGLERVVAAAPQPTIERSQSVLLTSPTGATRALIKAAQLLQQQGYRTMLDVRERSYANNLHDARRRSIEYVAVVSPDQYVLHDLHTGTEQEYHFDE